MGTLLRRYWLPALSSAELEPDGRPVRVRLLGEQLVAFRDTEGRVGVLDEHCPHRQVSLYFGRNEQSGLRCVYHGWKFDVQGRCVDLPSEPPGSAMRDRVRARAWPCAERGGVVWVFLGEGEPPALPEFEWAQLPAGQRYTSRRLLECNWAQALEGDIDSSHASFLHSRLDPADYTGLGGAAEMLRFHGDRHPRYEVLEAAHGLVMAARRSVPPDRHHWRAAQFLLPFVVLIAPFDDDLPHCNMWVPMDDTTTMAWAINWHPSRPLTGQERAHRDTNDFFHCTRFEPPTGEAGGAWRPAVNRRNGYGLDLERQRTHSFLGIRQLWCQDKAVQESMGSVVDRTREHLAPSDLAIVHWRRRMLALAQAAGDADLPGLDPRTHHVRPVSLVLPAGADWRAELFAATRGVQTEGIATDA